MHLEYLDVVIFSFKVNPFYKREIFYPEFPDFLVYPPTFTSKVN